MSDTIESIHLKILQKFNELESRDPQNANIAAARAQYEVETADSLICYYNGKHSDYLDIVYSGCILSQLREFCADYAITAPEFRIKEDIADEISHTCSNCAQIVTVCSQAFRTVCEHCGNTELLYGIIFDDGQYYYNGHNSTNSTNSSDHDIIKHYRKWMSWLMAECTVAIPPATIDLIRDKLRNEGKTLALITYEQVRGKLKQLKLTKYFNYIPYIIKQLNGSCPRENSHELLKKHEIIFVMFIKDYETQYRSSNKKYYPFFIGKIIQHFFAGTTLEDILRYIHRQEDKTIVKNEKIFNEFLRKYKNKI